MKKKTKQRLIFNGIIGGLCVLLGFCPTYCTMHHKLKAYKESAARVEEIEDKEDEAVPEAVEEIVYYQRQRVSYSTWFADINDLHLEAAAKFGLHEAPDTRENIDTKKSDLVRISDNKYYTVDKLNYSVPYLTRGGAHLLDNISIAFADSLSRKGFPEYRLIVTSVLRTKEDVNRLRRSGNVNASDASAHNFGTTFDIAYTRYDKLREGGPVMNPYELSKVLAEVLRDQKAANNCYIKYERKQHCFHITSRLAK